MKKISILLCLILSITFISSHAQQIEWTAEQIKTFTSDYQGERSADGRPHVSDALIKRLANVSTEEAWGFLRNKGYHNQFDAGWVIIGDKPLVGRVVTTQYMPSRPDMDDKIKAKGKQENRVGSPNSWPIDVLQNGDVYVADGFGKIIDGTLIGDNLANAIYAKSNNGVVFDAGARDIEGISKIDGFVGFVRGLDPSYIQGVMMTCINCPIRIGRATVLPGDLVLGKQEGVVFIPAQFAEDLILNSEFTALRDEFGVLRLKQGTYTPGEVDMRWSDKIKNDFLGWIKANPQKLQMTPAEFDDYMKERNW
ncbi:RraA family protein [Arcticibacterium luteifluviistationis]|uniref:Dimethylmenaquinone methyltransferase n=1 Tax=Arcticibacterium luteifluviistationis TaxID=1784714 RepID=A0A2Z4GEA5_9BACT|nr:RraA family protein [Arcticibacterium luteifluviistationis]AWV99642.1 dimethylmenaquinone methyltransferase [Arcticibacterium luteifluviistationis]